MMKINSESNANFENVNNTNNNTFEKAIAESLRTARDNAIVRNAIAASVRNLQHNLNMEKAIAASLRHPNANTQKRFAASVRNSQTNVNLDNAIAASLRNVIPIQTRRSKLAFKNVSGVGNNCGYRAYILGKKFLEFNCIDARIAKGRTIDVAEEIKLLRRTSDFMAEMPMGCVTGIGNQKNSNTMATTEDVHVVALTQGYNVVFLVQGDRLDPVSPKTKKYGYLVSYAYNAHTLNNLRQYAEDIDNGFYPLVRPQAIHNTIFIYLHVANRHFQLLIPAGAKACKTILSAPPGSKKKRRFVELNLQFP